MRAPARPTLFRSLAPAPAMEVIQMDARSEQAAWNLPRIQVGVYRRLDNRFEGLPDDSPRGLELHNTRKEALHEVFDAEESAQVLDWGATGDTHSHEYIELLIGAVATPALDRKSGV